MTIDLDKIKSADEETYLKAVQAVKRKRVIKFTFMPSGLVLWGVYSRKRDKLYLVIPNLYCSCTGFLMNVIMMRKKEYCYHIIAQKIAEESEVYEEEVLSDDEYLNFLEMIKRYVISVH